MGPEEIERYVAELEKLADEKGVSLQVDAKTHVASLGTTGAGEMWRTLVLERDGHTMLVRRIRFGAVPLNKGEGKHRLVEMVGPDNIPVYVSAYPWVLLAILLCLE